MAWQAIGKIDPSIMNEKLIPAIIGLYKDPVPNVWFNIAKFLDDAINIISDKNTEDAKQALKTLAKTDSDDDVKFFVKETLWKPKYTPEDFREELFN